MCFAIHLQNSYSSTNHTYLRQSHQIFWYLCDGAMIKHVELKQFMLKLRTMTEKMSATYPASEFLRVCHIFYKECKKYNRFLNQMKQKKRTVSALKPQYCTVQMEHGSDVKVQRGVEPLPSIIVLQAEQMSPNGKKPSL